MESCFLKPTLLYPRILESVPVGLLQPGVGSLPFPGCSKTVSSIFQMETWYRSHQAAAHRMPAPSGGDWGCLNISPDGEHSLVQKQHRHTPSHQNLCPVMSTCFLGVFSRKKGQKPKYSYSILPLHVQSFALPGVSMVVPDAYLCRDCHLHELVTPGPSLASFHPWGAFSFHPCRTVNQPLGSPSAPQPWPCPCVHISLMLVGPSVRCLLSPNRPNVCWCVR